MGDGYHQDIQGRRRGRNDIPVLDRRSGQRFGLPERAADSLCPAGVSGGQPVRSCGRRHRRSDEQELHRLELRGHVGQLAARRPGFIEGEACVLGRGGRKRVHHILQPPGVPAGRSESGRQCQLLGAGHPRCVGNRRSKQQRRRGRRQCRWKTVSHHRGRHEPRHSTVGRYDGGYAQLQGRQGHHPVLEERVFDTRAVFPRQNASVRDVLPQRRLRL